MLPFRWLTKTAKIQAASAPYLWFISQHPQASLQIKATNSLKMCTY
jgi:hypothetical protein